MYKQLIVAALAAVTLSSCSKEDQNISTIQNYYQVPGTGCIKSATSAVAQTVDFYKLHLNQYFKEHEIIVLRIYEHFGYAEETPRLVFSETIYAKDFSFVFGDSHYIIDAATYSRKLEIDLTNHLPYHYIGRYRSDCGEPRPPRGGPKMY